LKCSGDSKTFHRVVSISGGGGSLLRVSEVSQEATI
jgi:hypothetical protein